MQEIYRTRDFPYVDSLEVRAYNALTSPMTYSLTDLILRTVLLTSTLLSLIAAIPIVRIARYIERRCIDLSLLLRQNGLYPTPLQWKFIVVAAACSLIALAFTGNPIAQMILSFRFTLITWRNRITLLTIFPISIAEAVLAFAYDAHAHPEALYRFRSSALAEGKLSHNKYIRDMYLGEEIPIDSPIFRKVHVESINTFTTHSISESFESNLIRATYTMLVGIDSSSLSKAKSHTDSLVRIRKDESVDIDFPDFKYAIRLCKTLNENGVKASLRKDKRIVSSEDNFTVHARIYIEGKQNLGNFFGRLTDIDPDVVKAHIGETEQTYHEELPPFIPPGIRITRRDFKESIAASSMLLTPGYGSVSFARTCAVEKLPDVVFNEEGLRISSEWINEGRSLLVSSTVDIAKFLVYTCRMPEAVIEKGLKEVYRNKADRVTEILAEAKKFFPPSREFTLSAEPLELEGMVMSPDFIVADSVPKELPEDGNEITPGTLLKIFDAIPHCTYDPNGMQKDEAYDFEGNEQKAKLRKALQNLVSAAECDPNNTQSLPSGADQKNPKVWIKKLNLHVRHITYLLQLKSTSGIPHFSPAEQGAYLVQLATAAQACGGAYNQATSSTLTQLSLYTRHPHYEEKHNLDIYSDFDQKVLRQVLLFLKAKRVEIFERLVAQFYDKNYNSLTHFYKDKVHTRKRLLSLLGEVIGHPETENAADFDPYEGAALKISESAFLSAFFDEYTPAKMVAALKVEFDAHQKDHRHHKVTVTDYEEFVRKHPEGDANAFHAIAMGLDELFMATDVGVSEHVIAHALYELGVIE